ncbi:exonuclease [Rhodobacteraceae bacterium 2CG4]|uniref:DNA-directed DNA polymerase n=1 Tax=Halovulum marinum TaxID=2662447 RepID=A0A6L5Z654_9RHOB|nr:exonuclease domain-containing protein [Halovulum marinum]MSU91462.1 exonuclease [Halovulum marinum]
MHDRLGLRQRVALFFVALALGGCAALALGLWLGARQAGGPAQGYVIAGVVGGLGIAGLAAWIGLLFDEHVARPILALSGDLATRARLDVREAGIDQRPARHLGALAAAAGAISAALVEARVAREQAVADQTRRLQREKVMFEALVRDLAEGVIVATTEHRVMLYNRAAQDLLGGLGLDRPLDRVLRPEPIRHALERLAARHARGGAGAEPFLATSCAGERMLLGQVSRIDMAPAGYVLILRDTTEELAVRRERDHLFHALMEGVRRPVSAVGAILDAHAAAPDMDPATRARFTAAQQQELGKLFACLRDLETRYAALARRRWPMSKVAVRDILDGLGGRGLAAAVVTAADPDEAFVRCDAFAVIEMLSNVLHGMAGAPGRSGVTAGTEARGAEIWLTLGWQGPGVADGELQNWLARPLSPGYGAYTGRDTLAAHGTEIWAEPDGQGGHRLVLPLEAAAAPEAHPSEARPEFYDFDLPTAADAGAMADRPLAELPFVVFDTETTGLEPASGDRIVQIAGVRIVNGRLLRGERFDALVDPGRPIPPASTLVHRITDDMVAGAPDIAAAGRAFHEFCAGAVLVAHNAPFDMAFLKAEQRRIGRAFDNPVLCTVLLSSVLFGEAAAHSLDALAARFGIEIPPERRHTALGDALATGQVFCHLVALLRAEGIETLQQAIDASQRQTRIRRRQAY